MHTSRHTYDVSLRTFALIAALSLIKAIAIFGVYPAFAQQLGELYGIGFADNYHMLGQSLAAGHGFRFTADTAPTLMREPGYPMVLAALFYFFGVSLAAARALNLVLGVASATFVSMLARRLTGTELAARIAAVLFMIHPGVVVAELRGGVESLFIALLLLFFLATLRALASGRNKDYLVAGLVLGLTSLVRGTALLFPPFLLLYFLIWERGRTTVAVMAVRVTIMLTAAMLTLSPWIVRNYRLVHTFAPTASVAGVSAHAGYYICTHLAFSNELERVDGDAALERAQMARQQGYRFKEFPGLYYLYFYDVNDEVNFNGYLGARVLHDYVQSPGLLLSCMSKNAFNFWFAGKSWTSTALNAVVQIPYMILGFAGLIVGLRGRSSGQVGMLAIFVLYTLCVYLPILAQARYSVHIVPILSIFAAIYLSGRRVGNATPVGT